MHLTALFIASLTSGALATVHLRSLASSSLLKRQFDPSGLPSQCESECESVSNAVSGCTTANCLCSTSVINQLAACFQCAGDLVGDQQALQSSLDEIVQECAQEGVSGLPDPTLTGGGGGSIPTPTGANTVPTTGATTAAGGATTSPASSGSGGSNPLPKTGSAAHIVISNVWSLVVLAAGATFGATVL